MLPLDAAQVKKQTFAGALDLQVDLAATSQQPIASTCVEQKLLTIKEPLELSGHRTSSLPWSKTSLPASKANNLQILSSPQSLRLFTKVKFWWQMSPFQETTSCALEFLK